MTPPPKLFQALLRPAILQILRATGFHSTRPAVLDSFAELAGAYMLLLCQAAAAHANSHRHVHTAFEDDGTAWMMDAGGAGGMTPTIVDLRMALQDVGALLPERTVQEQALVWPPPKEKKKKKAQARKRTPHREVIAGQHDADGDVGMGLDGGLVMPKQEDEATQETAIFDGIPTNDDADDENADEDEEDGEDEIWLHNEDLRGVEEFIAWFSGPKMKELQALTMVDGELEATDYLNALKKKHSKTGEDSKYHGTILGKGNDAGEILIEGGDTTSVQAWMDKMHKQAAAHGGRLPHANGHGSESGDNDSRPGSSGLSSLGDRIDEEDMMMDLT